MRVLRSNRGFGLTEFVLVTVVVAVAVGVFLACTTHQAAPTEATEFAIAPSGPTDTAPAADAPALCVDQSTRIVGATPVA